MRIPVRKSIWWVIYHRSDKLFSSLLLLLGGIIVMVLAFVNFKKTPAAIVMFVASVYAVYLGTLYTLNLIKEWRNV